MMKCLILLSLFMVISCDPLQKFDRPVKDEDSFSDVDEEQVPDLDSDEISDETGDADSDESMPCGSVYFNGVDSYISVEHDDALNLGNTWTIEAWVMQDDTENQAPLIRKGDMTDLPSYWLYGKSKIDSSTYTNTPNGGYQYGEISAADVWLHSSKEVENMKWYHVALVKTDTILKLFVDGVFQSAQPSDSNMINNSQNLYFGVRPNNNPLYFWGFIDEIRFSSIPRYSVNFTPEKRLTADNETTAVWHFEESNGTETVSEGKNFLKGILHGSAEFVKECAVKGNECVNECFFEGQTKCNEGILKTCVKDNNGCLKFNIEECVTGICADNLRCVVDNCPFAGMTECVDGSARICKELENGILDWSLSAKCSGNECADAASCLSCVNGCSFLGQSFCFGGNAVTCINDNCLRDGDMHHCSLGECSGGAMDATNCRSDGWIDISGGFYKCGINGSGELYCWKDSPYPEKISNRTDWSKVSVSSYDTSLSYFCAIASGELYCMGHNVNGELGDGTTVSKTEMVRIGSRSDWSDIYAHFLISNDTAVYFTCGIAAGELFCWGNGILSPEKMGTRTDWQKITGNCGIASGKLFCWDSLSSQPAQIGNKEDWEDATSSVFGHYCAISSGELFCWGNNDYGQLGDGTFQNKTDPVKIGARNDWEKVIGGYNFTCGIAGGELFCWGSNNSAFFEDDLSSSVNIPTKISTMNNWSELSYFPLCGVESENIYCWNIPDSVFQKSHALFKVMNISGWEHISTGNDRACGINKGTLFCNKRIEHMFYSDFSQVTGISDWSYVSTGDYHSCAIRNEDLYCWGNNHLGQVGDSSFEDRENPVQIGSDRKWESVSCGLLHTCGISAGELFCWGSNSKGQIGGGIHSESDFPRKIGEKNKWKKISAGGAHTCGIESGELFCWGNEIVYEPLKIGDRSDWEQVVSGDKSSCGIASGELFCWGQITANLTGKLKIVPTKIGNYTDFEQVTLSEHMLCGLRSDKHLYCFSNINIVTGYNAAEFYPEKVAEIEWNNISEGGNICGINDKKELHCTFTIKSYYYPQMLINP